MITTITRYPNTLKASRKFVRIQQGFEHQRKVLSKQLSLTLPIFMLSSFAVYYEKARDENPPQ